MREGRAGGERPPDRRCDRTPAFWLVARGFSGPLSRAASVERAASGSVTSAVEESLGQPRLGDVPRVQQRGDRRALARI